MTTKYLYIEWNDGPNWLEVTKEQNTFYVRVQGWRGDYNNREIEVEREEAFATLAEAIRWASAYLFLNAEELAQ